jgi:hypothetical protein
VRRLLLVAMVASTLAACAPPENAQAACSGNAPLALMAESVPTAAFVPCVRALPPGWAFDTFTAQDEGTTFTLARDAGGTAEVTLKARCAASDGTAAGEARTVSPNGTTTTWVRAFDGGCVRERVVLPNADPNEASSVHSAIDLVPRASVAPSR